MNQLYRQIVQIPDVFELGIIGYRFMIGHRIYIFGLLHQYSIFTADLYYHTHCPSSLYSRFHNILLQQFSKYYTTLRLWVSSLRRIIWQPRGACSILNCSVWHIDSESSVVGCSPTSLVYKLLNGFINFWCWAHRSS